MAKKKIAGQTRPYWYHEFFNIIEKIANEQDFIRDAELDYFSPCFVPEETISNPWCVIESKTTFGANEGIYTDFIVKFDDGVVTKFATAKTLYEDFKHYLAMSILGAKFSWIANEYIREHPHEFTFD